MSAGAVTAPFQLDQGLLLRPGCLIPWCSTPQAVAALTGAIYERSPARMVRLGKARILDGIEFIITLDPDYRPRFRLFPVKEYDSAEDAYAGLKAEFTRAFGTPGLEVYDHQDKPTTTWRFGKVYVTVGVGNRFTDYLICVVGHDDWEDQEATWNGTNLLDLAMKVPLLGKIVQKIYAKLA